MIPRLMVLSFSFLLCSPLPVFSQALILTERDTIADGQETTGYFIFNTIPSNQLDDIGSSAIFSLVKGNLHTASGTMFKANDGPAQFDFDQPGESVFAADDQDNIQIVADLGRVYTIGQVNTYSWHEFLRVLGNRAPQHYELFASDGRTPGFDPNYPFSPGWVSLGKVDTSAIGYGGLLTDQPGSGYGGQHGVSYQSATGILGRYRYFFWDIFRSTGPSVATTFYGEFDIVLSETEPNYAPILHSIPPQGVMKGSPVTFIARATDDNYPDQSLTFSLVGHSIPDAQISADGTFSWDTSSADPGHYEFTIKVIDNGNPPLSATGIALVELLPPPFLFIESRPDGCRVFWESIPNEMYRVEKTENLSRPEWIEVFRLEAFEEESEYIDTDVGNRAGGFYRLVLESASPPSPFGAAEKAFME